MRGFLIVSHGDLAVGMKMSAEMIAGERDNVFALGLTSEGGISELEKKLGELVPKIEKYDDFFIFTDLFGGSPGNTVFMEFITNEDVTIISGFNLPMILSAILTPDINSEALINEAKSGIVDVREKLSNLDYENIE